MTDTITPKLASAANIAGITPGTPDDLAEGGRRPGRLELVTRADHLGDRLRVRADELDDHERNE
jgi:hypothetical protein